MDHDQPGRGSLRHGQAIDGPSRGVFRLIARHAGFQPRATSPAADGAHGGGEFVCGGRRASGSAPQGSEKPLAPGNCRGGERPVGQILRQFVTRRQAKRSSVARGPARRSPAAAAPSGRSVPSRSPRVLKWIVTVGYFSPAGRSMVRLLVVLSPRGRAAGAPSIHSPWTSRRNVPAAARGEWTTRRNSASGRRPACWPVPSGV